MYIYIAKNDTRIFQCQENDTVSSQTRNTTEIKPVVLLTGIYPLITPRSRALLEKLTDSLLVKNFPLFYGIKLHCRFYKNQPPIPILSQINPTYSPIPLINIILPSTPGSSKRSHSLRFPHQNRIRTSPSKRATFPALLILLGFITLILWHTSVTANNASSS